MRTEAIPRTASSITRYALALLIIVAALILRELLNPLLGDLGPFLSVFAAVTFASVFLGAGPATLAALLGLLGSTHFFLARDHFNLASRPDIAYAVGYLVVAATIIVLAERGRRALAEVQAARHTLESKVEERTGELQTALTQLREEMNVRAQAEEARRKISARITKIQDEERRHIARELHDSIGQTLAALKMTVTPLSSIAPAGTATSKRVHEVDDLIDEAIRQTRTVSHLLHPPLLEELGFASAASWYVTEFSRRSGIEVNLDLPNDPPRFADSTELTLYRVVQESLTNILRHSESRKAEVRLEVARGEISLSVKDYGKGMTKGQIDRIMKTAGGGGVGLRGMQERIADLGGTVELQSTGTGTTVKAILPLTKSNRNGAVGIESQTTGLSANATDVRVKPS
jgi:signal transduction histidine kinase